MKGFSLVEIIVVSVIFAVVLGGLMAALSGGSSAVRHGMAVLDLYSTTGLALEHLKRDLRLLYGPVPASEFVGQGELSIRFMCVDSIDEASGTGPLKSVQYRFLRSDGHRQSELIRNVKGRTTSFGYDREVSFLVGADPRAYRTDRAVEISFAFPQDRTNAARLPGVQLTTLALNRASDGTAPLVSGRTGGVTKVNLLPSAEVPWTSDGSFPGTPAKDLFPEDAFPTFLRVHGF